MCLSLSSTAIGRGFLGVRECTVFTYRLGQISEGCMESALAISHSPLGQGRIRVLANVEDASPAALETADMDIPLFFNAARISAGCESTFIIEFT